MVRRSTDGGISEYNKQQQSLVLSQGKRKREKEEEVADWLGQNGGLHEHLDWATTLRK
jgi:hypothetical protein